MKKVRNFITSMLVLAALSTSSVNAADCNTCCAPAYCDSCDQGCCWSAAVPIAILVVAGVIIATTGRNHHHHHSSSCGTSSHSHCGCSF